MHKQLLTGRLVRLTAEDPEKDAGAIERWTRDTEYQRYLEVHPIRPYTEQNWRKRLEGELNDRYYAFGVRPLDDERLIGFVALFSVRALHGEAFVGIGIGERELWGKGYGTDAMQVLLGFAFDELNLHRVTLMVLADNARAVRSYEKCGFVYEGRLRLAEHRGGRRQDLLMMGILREEWVNA
jgi:RimJ/RimL family protein N-acetyltransferase